MKKGHIILGVILMVCLFVSLPTDGATYNEPECENAYKEYKASKEKYENSIENNYEDADVRRAHMEYIAAYNRFSSLIDQGKCTAVDVGGGGIPIPEVPGPWNKDTACQLFNAQYDADRELEKVHEDAILAYNVWFAEHGEGVRVCSGMSEDECYRKYPGIKAANERIDIATSRAYVAEKQYKRYMQLPDRDPSFDASICGASDEYEGEGGECFIATAAYGTPMNKNIDVLRKFRDKILIGNSPGESFVKTYYSTSPPIAQVLSNNEFLRTATRVLLITPLVYAANTILNGTFLIILGFCIVVGLFLARKNKIRASKILKSLGLGVLTAAILSMTVFILGYLSYSASFFAVIAACILPLIIPLSLSISVLSMIRLSFLRCQKFAPVHTGRLDG